MNLERYLYIWMSILHQSYDSFWRQVTPAMIDRVIMAASGTAPAAPKKQSLFDYVTGR